MYLLLVITGIRIPNFLFLFFRTSLGYSVRLLSYSDVDCWWSAVHVRCSQILFYFSHPFPTFLIHEAHSVEQQFNRKKFHFSASLLFTCDFMQHHPHFLEYVKTISFKRWSSELFFCRMAEKKKYTKCRILALRHMCYLLLRFPYLSAAHRVQETEV